MKVAFIIVNLSTGGAETMLYKLLKSIDKNKFEPYVFSLISKSDFGPKIEKLGIPVFSLGMQRGSINPLSFIFLVYKLFILKPDIVHTWMYHADLIGGLAARIAGCRRVIWGIRHSNLSVEQNKRSTLLVVKLCSYLSYWIPYRILSCSFKARQTHENYGYKKNLIDVIPNGFDLKLFTPDLLSKNKFCRDFEINPSAILIGMIARFHKEKNHIGFLDAAVIIQSKFPDVIFVLAGTDVDIDNKFLVDQISIRSLKSNFLLLGKRDDVPFLMSTLDVLVSPSHGEAFPNVLGEAMACSVPCVVTDVGDSAEIVANTGRIVPPNDMLALANSVIDILSLTKEQRCWLGDLARQRVNDNYEINCVVSKYQSYYFNCLNQD